MQRRGLWIPEDILMDKTLGWTDKMVLSYIISLAHPENPQRLDVSSVAARLGLAPRRTQQVIKKLKESGFLDTFLFLYGREDEK